MRRRATVDPIDASLSSSRCEPSSAADRATTGIVFNVQRYSVHDGAGIRTLVFLKGCSLRCLFCSNPESQNPKPDLVFNADKCLGAEMCSECVAVCATGALLASADGRMMLDRARCDGCARCLDACPTEALNVYGQSRTVDDVLAAVEQDGVFYARSGGGMTLSGGEPMRQPEFAVALLREAKRRHIHTAVETCGCCSWSAIAECCKYLDEVFFDIKHLDPDAHRQFTGASNEIILSNFNRLCEEFPRLTKRVRTPVIPGFNDCEEAIRAIADYLRGKPAVTYSLLPYHRMGTPKYAYLGRDYPMGEARLPDGVMSRLEAAAWL